MAGMAGAVRPDVPETAKPGKYLTFQLGAELYGVAILKVQEIIGLLPVTRVPRAPEFVRGVINLRGRIIPVMDLRRKFGLEHQDDTERSCIVVTQVAQGDRRVTTGVLVDEVSEVLNVGEEQIEGAPSFGAGADTRFLMGIAKVAQKVVMLLDMDRILSQEDMQHLDEVAVQA